MAKVLVSLDEALLRRIDRRAAELGISRSAFVARLASAHLQREGGGADPAARRSVARARAACAGATPAADATALVRAMRDER